MKFQTFWFFVCNRFLVICLALFMCGCQSQWEKPTLAFPGAEGFGKYTQGGRGGEVLVVTSLDDSVSDPAPGTLRHAIQKKGPRTIVFAVSGIIELEGSLDINNDYLTIAGQTSPGGIVLRGASTKISANEVIIRYLRFRLGEIEADSDAAMGIGNKNIIIDHCSFSWSIDETASFYGNRNFTLQYSIISESLNNAGHSKGAHGYGGIWGGAGASFHHNVLAHHSSRNPRINGYRLRPEYPQSDELVDVRNNVIYNWDIKTSYGNEDGRLNLHDNYFKPGPAAGTERFFELTRKAATENFGELYIAGNIMVGNSKLSENNRLGVIARDNSIRKSVPVEKYLRDSPFRLPQWTREAKENAYHTAEKAYSLLVETREVGANRRRSGVFLDSVDRRILREIANASAARGTGIIDSESEVLESWSDYAEQFLGGDEVVDQDLDGLPDEWEKARKINQPNDHDISPVYTNIEIFLNELGAF